MIDRIETPTIGEILSEEFMQPLGISAHRLAGDIFVTETRVRDILSGREKIGPDMSLRLGLYFGVSDRYFLDIQSDIDIRDEKRAMHDELAKIGPCSTRGPVGVVS
ncbi:MAG: HigA family addiction module antidote protein [Synergistaceae bacterium]|nr:HigA family addiction module antidote protein [Synergistaceae bacterium]